MISTKKGLIGAFSTGVLVIGLTGCGTQSSATSATQSSAATSKTTHKSVTVTLSGWTSSPVEATLMKKELTYFEKQYPWIHVKYRPISGNYNAVLKTRLVAGNAPDVIYVNNGGQSSSFIANHDILPLNKYIKASHFPIHDFYKGSISLFEKNGQIYGIPKDQSPLVLFYNKSLFAKANLKPPTTWAQFAADAKKLTNHASHQYGLINSAQEPRWAEFVYQAGGSIMNASMTKMTLNTKAALKGFSFFVDLYRQGYAALPSKVGASWGGQAFGEGKSAMVLSGNWLVPYLQKTYPKTKFGTVPMPMGPANNQTLTFPVSYSISKDSKHPQASWDLIRYLTSTKGMTQWLNQGFALPTRKSLTKLTYFKTHPVEQALIKSLPVSIPWNFPPGFVQYSSTTMTNQTTLAIMNKETPAAALATMQKDGSKLIK